MKREEDELLRKARLIAEKYRDRMHDYERICPSPWTDKLIDFIRRLFTVRRRYRT